MRIKYSKRGLTFSFNPNDTFKVGKHYRYIVDLKNSEIVIVPDINGKYIFSKKGINEKPLVDLRNEEIRNTISAANYMEVEIQEDHIIVHLIKLNVNTESLSDIELANLIDKSDETTIEIPKDILLAQDERLNELLRASGCFSQAITNINYVFDLVSLFSGAGLLDYPFKQDDSFDIKFAVDFDKSACQTYAKNIGQHILCMDIRDLQESQVPDCDVVLGGVCCQGYSNANRAGNITQDVSKRLLVDDFIRIVKAKQPLIFLIENVEQFLTKENGKYLEKVLSGLNEYQISYSVVNDWELGGYSTRKRMLLFGAKKEVGKIIIPDLILTNKKTAGDALRKVDMSWPNYSDITKASDDTQRKMAFVRPGHNYKDIPELAQLDRHSNVYRRLADNEPSVTLTNWRKVNLMPPTGNRVLSVSEAAAIMGLDKSFEFLGSLNDRQQQVGNGVTYAIASFAKVCIKNALYAYANRKIGLV